MPEVDLFVFRRFARQQGPEQRGRVLDRLAHMIKQGKLKPR